MKVKEFCKSLTGTKKEKRGLESILNRLEAGLIECDKRENYIYSVIALFNLTSPIYDSKEVGKIYHSLRYKSWRKKDNLLNLTKDLREVIRQTGRDFYGMNRSGKGQMVTAQNVYLGGLYGVFTKNASYWLREEKSLKSTIRGDLRISGVIPSEWYIINDVHAGIFYQSNVKEIRRLIEWYRTGVRPGDNYRVPQDFARLD